MSIKIVDPTTWNAFDGFFGTKAVEEANELGIIYDGWKRPTKAERESFQGVRPTIGTQQFETAAFSNEIERIRDSFAFDKSIVDFGMKDDEDKIFENTLEVINIMIGGAKILPLDRIDKAKDIIKTSAQVLKKYLPDFQSIAKLISLAPGLKDYEQPLKAFGKSLDDTISILAINDPDSVRKACDKIREGLEEAKKLKISEINKLAKGIKDSDVKSGPKKPEKEEEKEVKTEPQQKAAAFTQTTDGDPTNPFAWFMNQPTANPMDPLEGKEVPEAFRGDLNSDGSSNKAVPEYMAQNTVNVPKTDPMGVVFNPITQQEAEYLGQIFSKHPWINDLKEIANSNGYLIHPEAIFDNDKQLALVFVRTFNNGNLAYIQDKSFIIDLGKVVDNRFGIWPVANPDGSYNILEAANVVYSLFEDKGKKKTIDKDFLDKVFKFGLSGLEECYRKEHVLYNERMLITNRRINLLTMPTKDVDSATRNLIRGACIRYATQLDPNMGRFAIRDLDPRTKTFILDNKDVVENYLIPNTVQRPWTVIYAWPEIDKDGKFVPANEKKGTDIKYVFGDKDGYEKAKSNLEKIMKKNEKKEPKDNKSEEKKAS